MECWDIKHCIVKIPYGTRSLGQLRKWQIFENGKLMNISFVALC